MEDGSQQSQHQAAESVQTEVKSEQQVDGPSGQPQQQETSTEPLTSSSNVNGQHEADQQNASVATQPDEAASETLPTESTSDTVATTLTTTDVVYEPTAADKLNERDNVATATPSAGGPTNGLSKLSGHELDVAELKVKVICQEKNNTALKMELKCAELQVAAKEKLDVKKTRLIELLDAKVTALEKKNLRLVEMVEQMVRDKESHTHRLIDATKNIEMLSKKLHASERLCDELRNVNRELKSMLENVEGKGSQIAKLAKEKVLKYKEENERIQRELDDLKGGGGGGDAAFSSDGTGASTGLAASSKEEPSQDLGFGDAVSKAETLCGQLEAAVLGRDWQQESVDGLRAAVGEVLRISADLRPTFDQLRLSATAAVDGNRARKADSENAFKEEIRTKNNEIASLKDELGRLKAAIGQLVGLSALGVPAASAATGASVAPPSE